ncbi:MAG: hypothetical protein IJA97_01295 [Clostridia bacterium]|nr:hypothetical protein [Clostridia bacterium]
MDKFNFKYVAPTEEERKEIASIRKQYVPKSEGESKLERLRRLDAKVKNVPAITALILGVLGTLIFGLGLSMILEWGLLVWGIVICVVGAIPAIVAYPVYTSVLNSYKKRYGDEILKLSEELLNEKE